MTEIGIASIYKRDREDLRQWTDMDLVREAWLLKRKIACREGEQIVDEYEFGAEWEAALERRQAALTAALKKAGLEDFKIEDMRHKTSTRVSGGQDAKNQAPNTPNICWKWAIFCDGQRLLRPSECIELSCLTAP